MSTEQEILSFQSLGLPSDRLSQENAVIIMQVRLGFEHPWILVCFVKLACRRVIKLASNLVLMLTVELCACVKIGQKADGPLGVRLLVSCFPCLLCHLIRK